MRKLCDHARYYFSLVEEHSFKFLLRTMTSLSFIAVVLTFIYMCYYLYVDFNSLRVITGAVSLCTFIHLNKVM